MDIREGIRARLLADDACAGLLAERVYPSVLPPDCSYPAATYLRVSGVPNYSLSNRLSLTRMRLQIEVSAPAYTPASTAMDAILACLDNFSGQLPDGTSVHGIQVAELPTDHYDNVAKLHAVSTDFMVWFYS